MPTPREQAIRELLDELASRVESAKCVPRIDPWPHDHQPGDGTCHQTAEDWVRLRHPSWTVVRGWLVVIGTPGPGASYDAHSVVRDEQNQLWEVTNKREHDHSFIEHSGSEAEYLGNAASGGLARVVDEIDPAAVWLLYGHDAGFDF